MENGNALAIAVQPLLISHLIDILKYISALRPYISSFIVVTESRVKELLESVDILN